MKASDVRYAARGLVAAPGFTATVVASLAIGIAANAAAFAFLNAALFPTLYGVADQHRLVYISLERNCGWPRCSIRSSTFDDYGVLRSAIPGLSGLSANAPMTFAVAARGQVLSLDGALVSANYFDVFGVRLSVGRPFSAREEQPSEAAVAVIGHALWRSLFNSENTALGEFITVGGHQVRIVGVTPEGFSGSSRVGVRVGPQIWLPSGMADRVGVPVSGRPGLPLPSNEFHITYIGRLSRSSSVDGITSQAQVAAARVAAARPDGQHGAFATVRRVGVKDRSGIALDIAAIMLVPLTVLLIACVNAANLLLAHGTHRLRDTAVRLALGAGRWRIVRQLLTESLLLALLSAAITLPLLVWAFAALESWVPLPMVLDVRVVVFAVAAALASVVAFGLAPAIRLSGPSAALGSRTGDTPPRSRVRQGLVVAQVALSLGLLATGSQLVTAVVHLAGVTGAKEPEKLLMVSFDLTQLKATPAAADAFYSSLLDRVQRLPGVETAGLARATALWTFGRGSGSSPVIVWLPDAGPRDSRVMLGGFADGDVFEAVGLRLLQGRSFLPQDRGGRPRVAIVSRAAADRYFEGKAVGRIIRVAADGQRYEASHEVQIVGGIEPTLDPNYSRAPDASQAAIYLPARLEHEPALTLYVRALETPSALLPAIREVTDAVDSRVPFSSTSTLAERRYERQTEERLAAQGVVALGVLALALASGGLYGMVSFIVSMRRREIGVRMALGAEPRGILQLVLKQGMTMAILGAAIGGGIALVLSAVLRASMPGILPVDVGMFAGTAAVLTAAMLIASIIPARKAARVDPIIVLRED